MPFTLRYVQYMDVFYKTSNTCFGVRSLLVDEKALLIKKRPGRCVVLTTDTTITAVTSLIWSDRRVPISVQINLDDMMQNKMLMFNI